jgi:hypothetical protein
MSPDQHKFQMAVHDFQTARQRASIQKKLVRFSSKSTQPLGSAQMQVFAGAISPLGVGLCIAPCKGSTPQVSSLVL